MLTNIVGPEQIYVHFSQQIIDSQQNLKHHSHSFQKGEKNNNLLLGHIYYIRH